MPRPPKPFSVLETEKKSHRTKAELEKRKKEEAALESGTALKERSEVRKNKTAHKEFLRVNKILKNIQKNDALYEPVINRYAMMQAECADLEEKREKFYQLTSELEKMLKETIEEESKENRAEYLLEFSRTMSQMATSMINCDKQIQAKRKMLLEIEKENVMTVASALRSIPKKVEDESEDLLLTVLRGGEVAL